MNIDQVIEAALFCSEEPLSAQRLKSLFPQDGNQPDAAAIREAVGRLQEFYAERAVNLCEVASGFQFQTAPEFAPHWQRLHAKKPPKASKAYLETLAIIAYKQPVTRGDIEQVRGVGVNTHIIRSLEEREWIKCTGYRDVPGKPALYGTTKTFLDAFGLKSLSDMPALREVMDFEKVDREVAAQLELAVVGDAQPLAAADAEDSIMLEPLDIEDNEAKIDAAYDEAVELFNSCDELLIKADPRDPEETNDVVAESTTEETTVEQSSATPTGEAQVQVD